METKINVEGFKTKALFDTASELFINKVRRCGEDYDHRGVCSNTERKVHIRNLAREAAEEAKIFIEEVSKEGGEQ